MYFFMEINFDRMGYDGREQGKEAAAAWNEPGLGWDFLLLCTISHFTYEMVNNTEKNRQGGRF